MTTESTQSPATLPGGSAGGGAIRQAFGQARFVVACAVLLTAAVGLNSAVQWMQIYFKKEPVPLRKELATAMPATLGTWIQVARDETLDPETLAALQTDKFVFCFYVNAAAFGYRDRPEDLRRQFQGKTVNEQKAELRKLQQKEPHAVIQFAVTYYTDKADTVAHVPERCYVGDGYEPENAMVADWGVDRGLRVRHVNFVSRTGRPPADVAYFFHVNGHYEPNSLAVRHELADLFQRYGYYAKVELMCSTVDQAASARSMQGLLALALPHVEEALPDWQQYRSRR